MITIKHLRQDSLVDRYKNTRNTRIQGIQGIQGILRICFVFL